MQSPMNRLTRHPRKRGRPRDELRSARRREEILSAATRHFAEHGFHASDVQAIADELGLGKGTLYRYFPRKQQLFMAAVDRVMQRLHERIELVRAATPEPLEQIARVVVEYLRYFEENPAFVELLLQERAVCKDRSKPVYFQHREKRIGHWHEFYRGLMAAGRVRSLPADAITDVLSGALYGTMFVNFFAGRDKPLETQARQIVDIVFHGILSEEERRKGTVA